MKKSFSILLPIAAIIALSGCGHIMTTNNPNVQNGSNSIDDYPCRIGI